MGFPTGRDFEAELRRSGPFIVALAWIWLVPVALVWSFGDLYTDIPGIEPLALLFTWPFVAAGTLAPCFLTTVGIATGKPADPIACWACGVSISILCSLFVLFGIPGGVLAAFVPITTSVSLTGGIAIWFAVRASRRTLLSQDGEHAPAGAAAGAGLTGPGSSHESA